MLRLQSDERLIAMLRKGNTAAFETLVARYETRLLSFCRHLLGSREDAEDVLQEVMTAAFNAMLADERPINVRPWLYRIARNRSLNHLRRIQAVGVDSMDHHLSEHGASTADKVHEREEFRLLVGDIHELPETQKTALVLREMDALSYEQIAEAMETTIPSVKSLLVRARVSLAEASEARLLSCEEVRIELAEVAEGLQRRPSPLVRRHLRACKRCTVFRTQLRQTNKALAALLPIGPLVVFRKLLFLHLGHSAGAGAGSSATAAGSAGAASAGAASAGAAGTTALAGSGVVASSSGFVSAGIGALAGKAAVGLAAAALVTAGTVVADHSGVRHHAHRTAVASLPAAVSAPAHPTASIAPVSSAPERRSVAHIDRDVTRDVKTVRPTKTAPASSVAKTADKATTTTTTTTTTATTPAAPPKPAPSTGTTQTQSDPTVLPPSATTPTSPTTAAPLAPVPATTQPTSTPTATPTTSTTTSTTPTSTTTTPTTTPTPVVTTPTTPVATPTTPVTTPTTTTPAPVSTGITFPGQALWHSIHRSRPGAAFSRG